MQSRMNTLRSALAISMMAVIVVAANIMIRGCRVRLDMTADHLHTLDEGSRQILAAVEDPVVMRLYCTRGKDRIPPDYKLAADRVEDLLNEYRIAGDGKVVVEKLNPLPDTDAEDAALLDGVRGVPLDNYERLYLGISVSCYDRSVPFPHIRPGDESRLEYELTRAIRQVTNPRKTRLAVMSALPVLGQQDRHAAGRGRPMWRFVTELAKDFEVMGLPMDIEKIPGEVSILVLVHPRDIQPETLFAIDQFVLRGGKLIAFVDPACAIESKLNPAEAALTGHAAPPGTSTLEPLLTAWGVKYDPGVIAVDNVYRTVLGQDAGANPAVLTLHGDVTSPDDPTAAGLDRFVLMYSGVLDFEQPKGLDLKATTLLHTSLESQRLKVREVRDPDAVLRNFQSGNEALTLAIRLQGQLRTAYPQGLAGSPAQQLRTDSADITLFADADMIFDDVWYRRTTSEYVGEVTCDNNSMLQNLVAIYDGNEAMVSIRSRAAVHRPLSHLHEIELAAEKQYHQASRELQKELETARQSLIDLRQMRGEGVDLALVKQLEAMEQKQADVSRQLKKVRKQTRDQMNSLIFRIKLINTGMMPLLVLLVGLGVALARSRSKEAGR